MTMMISTHSFFQVLARDMAAAHTPLCSDFAYVPYLNSSLFEVTDLESKTIKINSLSQRNGTSCLGE